MTTAEREGTEIEADVKEDYLGEYRTNVLVPTQSTAPFSCNGKSGHYGSFGAGNESNRLNHIFILLHVQWDQELMKTAHFQQRGPSQGTDLGR